MLENILKKLPPNSFHTCSVQPSHFPTLSKLPRTVNVSNQSL